MQLFSLVELVTDSDCISSPHSSKKTRVSYTAKTKLEAIEHHREHGESKILIGFGISKSMLHDWRHNEEKLRETQKTRRSFRRGQVANAALEDQLVDWISERRARNRAVQIRDLKIKALEVAKDQDDDSVKAFEASNHWAERFMARNSLSCRRKTSVGQPLPPEFLAKIEQFQSFVKREVANVPPCLIGNMDETPVPFDIVSSRTIAPKGSDSVKIDITGHEKSNFTVVSCVLASGAKLPPMLIFEKKLVPEEAFPPGVVIKANEKGWMTESIMVEWITEVWEKCGVSNHDPRSSLLILDAAPSRFDRSSETETQENFEVRSCIRRIDEILPTSRCDSEQSVQR